MFGPIRPSAPAAPLAGEPIIGLTAGHDVRLSICPVVPPRLTEHSAPFVHGPKLCAANTDNRATPLARIASDLSFGPLA